VTSTFKRDRYFWAVAMQTVCVNIFLGSFGPTQPLLRADQGTSLTIAGLHGTAIGFASILAGLANPRLAHRFGRATTGWIGLTIFSIGLMAFVASPSVLFSIPTALLTGFGVSITINNALTSITSHFKEMSPMALTQSNAIGSCGYISGTLIVGTIANNYRDMWRLGMLIAIPLAILLFLMRDKTPDAHVPDEAGPQSGTLSREYWLSYVGFLACIASEFAISFWAAALIIDRTNASPAISTLTVAALGTGMFLGRWYGGRVLKHYPLDTQLILFIAIQAVGFAILWFSHNLFVSFCGVLIAGLGVSNQFALASLRMIDFSDDRPDLAIGGSSTAAGLAIAGSPFLLGVLGDQFGISRAYLMVPVLLFISYIIVQLVPSHVPQKVLEDNEL
jgi:predicted MFS family arabinose efflux permease